MNYRAIRRPTPFPEPRERSELTREHETFLERPHERPGLDDLKSRLLAGLSHELRTSLAMILGSLWDLEKCSQGLLAPEVAARIALARGHAEQVPALVDGLLELARADAGDLELRARPGHAAPSKRRLSAEDRAFLERVREVLETNLGDEGFNVAGLAVRLAVDRSQLFRRLKRLTGATPSQLLSEARLRRAAELLASGTSGVGEVALAAGFKSVSHFSERFRRRFGAPPSAWRRAQR